MRYFNVSLFAVSLMIVAGCAEGLNTKTPAPGKDCKVLSVQGNTVRTQGCQGWSPIQFGADGECMQILRPELKGDGTFVLLASSRCQHFSLSNNGKWLVIYPESESKRDNVCISEPTKGKGYAYHSCR